MDISYDLIGRTVDYCKHILAGSSMKIKWISYHSPRSDGIIGDKIIVRQRYSKQDDILELTYCMFN